MGRPGDMKTYLVIILGLLDLIKVSYLSKLCLMTSEFLETVGLYKISECQ